jgi:hypothetical protein
MNEDWRKNARNDIGQVGGEEALKKKDEGLETYVHGVSHFDMTIVQRCFSCS